MLSVVLAGGFWMACGGKTSSDTACAAGKDCVCDGANCDISCGGDSKGSCAFKCQGGATCTFTCEGGSCGTNCESGTSCTVKCPGGNCATHGNGATSVQVQCAGNNCGTDCASGATTCTVSQCTSSCALACGGAAVCSNSCGLSAGCGQTP
jgi:hypothetical protein